MMFLCWKLHHETLPK